ncbi:MAG TPA: hypothetical protein VMT85_12710 [Thermoanaerobaculia bacterium]|nr:hypothetical protein [Thermoanaerobaculia bacterium]
MLRARPNSTRTLTSVLGGSIVALLAAAAAATGQVDWDIDTHG